jgi:hypothetical protein
VGADDWEGRAGSDVGRTAWAIARSRSLWSAGRRTDALSSFPLLGVLLDEKEAAPVTKPDKRKVPGGDHEKELEVSR